MKYKQKDDLNPYKIDRLFKIADDFVAKDTNLIYCAEESMFYLWRDNYYQAMLTIETERYLMEAEELTYLNRYELNNFFKRLSCITMKRISEFNSMDILDFENGVLHVKSGEFTEHKKEYLSTIRLPYKYDKDAHCPIWMEFLNSSLEGDPVRIAVLQEYMGYCLGRDNSFHKALILLGEGRNGKGTTFHIINKMVGDKNCSALKLGDMCKREVVSELVGKLVNIDGDTDAGASGFESDFRRITAGDGVIARRLYKDAFKFYPYCKLIVGANDIPRIADKTHGFYDRLIIIPYNVSFAGREDRDLKYKLEAEISGILNWALIGRKRLYALKNFSVDRTMEDYVSDLKRENNPIELFIHELVGFHDDAITPKKMLYERYIEWCDDNGHKPSSKIRFGKEFFRLCKKKTKPDFRTIYEHAWPNVFIRGKNELIAKEQQWED